jgi:hypothetical protein
MREQESPEEYAFRLGFESGYVEALPQPPGEYTNRDDPYSRGYVAGNKSNGVGLSPELIEARSASIREQQRVWEEERRRYRKLIE